MAKEITYGGSLNIVKGVSRDSMSATGLSATMAGDHYVKKVVDVGEVEEQIDIEDIADIGFVMFRNLDDVSTISIGPAAGVYAMDLKPGETAGPMRWSADAAGAIYAIAAPYEAELECMIVEE